MTKRHFVAFAEYIRIELVNSGKLEAAKLAADMVATVAYGYNARFDYARFMVACGLAEKPTSHKRGEGLRTNTGKDAMAFADSSAQL
jgi:hypothetical protein